MVFSIDVDMDMYDIGLIWTINKLSISLEPKCDTFTSVYVSIYFYTHMNISNYV